MKLSFSTLGCPEWSFSEILSTAKDLGYDGIEIRGVKKVMDVPRIPQFSPEHSAETKKLLNDKGLEIVCLTSACCLNVPEGTKDVLYEATAYIDTAADMGVKYVRVLGDFSPAPQLPVDEKHASAMLSEMAVYASKKGVEILVETNGYFAKTERIVRLCESAGEGIGVIWDINHPYRFFGESPEETASNLNGLIKHVHFKDSEIADGKSVYRMMGYGDMPVERFYEAIEKTGYSGSYCLEWVKRWDVSLEEPGLAFAQYASFMRTLG